MTDNLKKGVKGVWHQYTNGTGSGITRIIVTALVAFAMYQVTESVSEIRCDISYLTKNIVPRNEFETFRNYVNTKCGIFETHIARDEYRWEIFDVKEKANGKVRG